jgi:hypothetical protein
LRRPGDWTDHRDQRRLAAGLCGVADLVYFCRFPRKTPIGKAVPP